LTRGHVVVVVISHPTTGADAERGRGLAGSAEEEWKWCDLPELELALEQYV